MAERKRPASIRDDYEGRIFVRSALVGYACNHCRLCRLCLLYTSYHYTVLDMDNVDDSYQIYVEGKPIDPFKDLYEDEIG